MGVAGYGKVIRLCKMPYKLTKAVGKLLFVENKKALRSIDRLGLCNAYTEMT